MKVPATHEELGQATHTALRKLCDSKATSALWNYIRVISPEEWTKILIELHGHLKQVQQKTLESKAFSIFPNKKPAEALKEAVMKLDYMGVPHVACFYCICCLFNASDWEGFAGYLES